MKNRNQSADLVVRLLPLLPTQPRSTAEVALVDLLLSGLQEHPSRQIEPVAARERSQRMLYRRALRGLAYGEQPPVRGFSSTLYRRSRRHLCHAVENAILAS